MNLKKYSLIGIYYSILLGLFSIIMGDKTNSFGFWEIGAHFIATAIKAFLVWIVNYYLLLVVKPKISSTLEFVIIFIVLNGLNTLFAQWLGMFFFPKFGVIASENGIYLVLRHVFVIILTVIVLNYLNYRTKSATSKQIQQAFKSIFGCYDTESRSRSIGKCNF